MLKQQTLKGSFTLNGKGLHTGVKLTVTFNPCLLYTSPSPRD